MPPLKIFTETGCDFKSTCLIPAIGTSNGIYKQSWFLLKINYFPQVNILCQNLEKVMQSATTYSWEREFMDFDLPNG